ncbi:hypothetical protein BHM03_00022779 [Ensete ventricosum]|nr:hypothetical protein BHM03_00022779 [Ensete ventricosum]
MSSSSFSSPFVSPPTAALPPPMLLHIYIGRSASGACRGYRELTRMAQGSSLEEDRDSWKIVGGSRKVYRELERFNHDGEKELQTIHEPRIKLRHQTKVWMMWWEFTGSSLGLR